MFRRFSKPAPGDWHPAYMEAAAERDELKVKLAKLEADIARSKQPYKLPEDVRQWSHFAIMMPLTEGGMGPATIGDDAVEVKWCVWDHFCDSYGTFVYLADAINKAISLTMAQGLKDQA